MLPLLKYERFNANIFVPTHYFCIKTNRVRYILFYIRMYAINYIHVLCVCVCVCIYINIEREREREREIHFLLFYLILSLNSAKNGL